MEKTISIEGMNCAHCSAQVEKALNALPGVSATVSLQDKTATIKTDLPISDDKLHSAITAAGYDVTASN